MNILPCEEIVQDFFYGIFEPCKHPNPVLGRRRGLHTYIIKRKKEVFNDPLKNSKGRKPVLFCSQGHVLRKHQFN